MAAPGWNDTYDADTDWTSVEFVNMFIRAHNERVNACNNSSLVISQISDGSTDIDRVSIWGTIQHNIINTLSIVFVRPDLNPLSITVSNTSATTGRPNFWTLVCDPTTYTPFSVSTESPQTGSLPYYAGYAGFFRRIAHRWITSLSATTDKEGNARAAGQKAHAERWITTLSDTTDTFGNSRATGQIARLNETQYVKYVSGSTWTSITSAMAEWGRSADWLGTYTYTSGSNWTFSTIQSQGDIVDSALSAPDHALYGEMRVNDLIGYWNFNEIRDYLKICDRTVPQIFWTDGAHSGNQTLQKIVSSGAFLTGAAARADAESKLAAATPTSVSLGSTSPSGNGEGTILKLRSSQSFSTGSTFPYTAFQTSMEGQPTIASLWVGSTIGAPSVSAYVRMTGLTDADHVYFDAGTGLSNLVNAYQVWELFSPAMGSGNVTVYGTMFNGSYAPSDWGPDPDATHTNTRIFEPVIACAVDWTDAFEFP